MRASTKGPPLARAKAPCRSTWAPRMFARAILAAAALIASTALAAEPASAGAADARSLYAEAERLRFAEEWYPAIESYLAAAAKNPSYGEAYAGLADCYYELGEYDQALSYVKKAAPFRKSDAALADLEGFIRTGLGDLAGARAAFESVAAALPNDLDARFGLSLLDLAAGRKTEARSRLEESLRLSPQNARALLSLALIAADQGRAEDSRALVEKALRYHGSEPRTQYVAARLAAAGGDLARAAAHARNALDLKPGYSEAGLLLGSLMYRAGSYDQAVALMREAVARNRKDGLAWYTLGLAQRAAGKGADAIYSLKTAAGLRPDDEIARLALESVVADSTQAEDSSRAAYADWHVARGRLFEERSSYDNAIFEYRRALRIYPYAKEARLLYAGILKARGLPGGYLSELEFLKDNGKADQPILDAIEAYESMLSDSVGPSWGVVEESLPKRHYKVALMYQEAPADAPHAAGEEMVLRYLKDIIASSGAVSALAVEPAAATFAEAFRRAREAGADYFAIVSFRETDRDVEIALDLRVARTGSAATSFKAFRSGNDRLRSSAARIVELLLAALPPRGELVARSQDRVLFDLGKRDGLEAGAKLVAVKRGSIQVNPEGLGLSYPASAALGEVATTRLGEEASEGGLKRSGFFDAVNVGDEVVLAPKAASGAAVTGSASAAGAAAAGGQSAPAPAVEPIKEWPGLFTAVRALR
jgi:tetratricopeptide (TPR) repeat protein